MEDERDPDRERRVSEQVRDGPEAITHRADLLEPHDAVGRSDRSALGVLGEHVHGRDLVEPRRRGKPRRGLDRRGATRRQREEERGRQDAEAGVRQTVGTRDVGQTALDRVDGLSDRAQRGAETREEHLELVLGRLILRRPGACRPTGPGRGHRVGDGRRVGHDVRRRAA